METPKEALIAQRWRALMANRMFFMMETARMMYVRLVMAEKGQKSIKSDRRKYIEAPNQAPGKCLHTGPHINRGNQYASWQVCSTCNARINYASRGRSKAKAKAKAPATVTLTSPYPHRTQGPITEPKNNKNLRSEVTEGAGSSSSTASPEIATALQMMASGFQQMNNTMAELMKGQNRMIMMMANSRQERKFGQMTFAEASEMAAQVTTEHSDMSVDGEGEEDGSWWMTGVICASTLVHLGQCSRELQERLRPHGGGDHSWMIYCQGSTAPDSQDPPHLQVPWVRKAGGVSPGCVTLWHEETGSDGEVKARGPGEPRTSPDQGQSTVRRWVLENKLLLPFQLYDQSVGM
eukprot:s1803_g13.t1